MKKNTFYNDQFKHSAENVTKIVRRFKRYKYKHELFLSSINLLLDRKPTNSLNQVWVGDVTFIRVGSKCSYLSAVMDRHTREITGWRVAHEQ